MSERECLTWCVSYISSIKIIFIAAYFIRCQSRWTTYPMTLYTTQNTRCSVCNWSLNYAIYSWNVCVLYKWKNGVFAPVRKSLQKFQVMVNLLSWVYLWLLVLMTSPSGRVTVGVSCVGFCVALCSCHSGFSDFVSVDVSGLTKLLWSFISVNQIWRTWKRVSEVRVMLWEDWLILIKVNGILVVGNKLFF